jgi:hypothetical protein
MGKASSYRVNIHQRRTAVAGAIDWGRQHVTRKCISGQWLISVASVTQLAVAVCAPTFQLARRRGAAVATASCDGCRTADGRRLTRDTNGNERYQQDDNKKARGSERKRTAHAIPATEFKMGGSRQRIIASIPHSTRMNMR